MKQSRRASLIESWANIFVGLSVQYVCAITFWRWMGYNVTWQDNTYFALLMTAVSLVRSYGLRRMFEHLRVSGRLR